MSESAKKRKNMNHTLCIKENVFSLLLMFKRCKSASEKTVNTQSAKYEVDPIKTLQKLVKTILKDQKQLRMELDIVSKREQELAIQYQELIKDYEIIRDEVTDLMYPPDELYGSDTNDKNDESEAYDPQDGWGDDYFDPGESKDDTDD